MLINRIKDKKTEDFQPYDTILFLLTMTNSITISTGHKVSKRFGVYTASPKLVKINWRCCDAHAFPPAGWQNFPRFSLLQLWLDGTRLRTSLLLGSAPWTRPVTCAAVLFCTHAHWRHHPQAYLPLRVGPPSYKLPWRGVTSRHRPKMQENYYAGPKPNYIIHNIYNKTSGEILLLAFESSF